MLRPTVNYAEQALSGGDGNAVVLVYASEHAHPTEVTREILSQEVYATARWLRQCGVGRGDLVVGYLPNVPEAVTAFLASASLGAVWSSCSPELSAHGVVQRYADLEPRALIGIDRFRHGGVDVDRRGDMARLREWIPSLLATALVPGNRPSVGGWPGSGPPMVEQLDFEHPLYLELDGDRDRSPWPRAVHHGPTLREHWRRLNLRMEVREGSRLLWATEPCEPAWHLLVSGLLTGAAIVLYDGDPTHPYLGTLWDLCDDASVTNLVVDDAFLRDCAEAGLEPAEERDLSRLRSVTTDGFTPLEGAASRITELISRPPELQREPGLRDRDGFQLPILVE